MRALLNRSLAILAACFGLPLLLAPVLASGPFPDVSSDAPYAHAINTLQSKAVLEGYPDGTFRPDGDINRAELLKIILEGRKGGDIAGSNCFPDVEKQWFAKYVCQAKDEGIVQGFDDGFFRPEQPVTFVEAAKIFANAFKQTPQGSGYPWYETYVRALEGSKAIPPQIAKLDAPLTRGQMAEILWRLSESVTDQPSIGYLNVAHPALAINTASDEIQYAKSCADLSAFMVETQTYGGGGGQLGGGLANDMMMREAVPAAVPVMQNEAKAADGSYSQTNVQVEGVDEGDIVKTDGTYLYVVSGNSVHIVKAEPATAMKEVSAITDTSSSFYPSDLYIDGDRLVVIGQTSGPSPYRIMDSVRSMIYPPYYYPSYRSLTQARIYDVSNHAIPLLERTVSFEGSSVSTRMIGSKLYLVVNQPMPYGPLPMLDDAMPKFQDSRDGSVDAPVAKCGSVAILPHIPAPQYLTVGVIDVQKPTSDIGRQVILGSADNVYASLENLYVATTQWIYHWDVRSQNSEEKTNIYRFAFTGDGIEFKSQGSVPGKILNQFSMDESGNMFRIATTKGQSWSEDTPSSNNIYVLNSSLEIVGKVEDLALGESIYAVRFLGKRAYLVTFKTVDPLFVVDLSSPRDPKVLGKLKIPGYSNYLHPYDDTHLIGFGKEVDESIDKDKVHSDDAVYYTAVQGLKMALFDVSDVEHPKEIAKEVIGDRGTDSPLLTNHKALLFEKDTGLLSFPIIVYKRTVDQPVSEQGKPIFQGAYVYKLTLDEGFTLKGTITQYNKEVYAKAGDYWYDAGKDVQRIVRIEDSLFTISNGGVQSNALGNLKKEGLVEFPQSAPPSPCGDYTPCAQPMR